MQAIMPCLGHLAGRTIGQRRKMPTITGDSSYDGDGVTIGAVFRPAPSLHVWHWSPHTDVHLHPRRRIVSVASGPQVEDLSAICLKKECSTPVSEDETSFDEVWIRIGPTAKTFCFLQLEA
jgi:hypothetical protein